MRKSSYKSILFVGMAGLLAACAETAELKATRASTAAGGETASLAQFSDIPIPAGAKMNVERSLILGTRAEWIGRLVFATSLSAQEAFTFFGREMTAFGWQEITRVRARISVLSFTRGDRAATIQISSSTLGGTEVDLTVSPVHRGGGAGGQGSAPMGR